MKMLLCRATCIPVLALVTSFSLASAENAPDEFALPTDLQNTILTHVAPARSSRTLQRVALTQELDHKANVGKMYVDSRLEFSILENGLVGSSGSTVFRSGNGRGTSRSVSLCGFIPLLTESSSTSASSTVAVVPIGKLFIPFGIKSSTDFNNRARLVLFESSIPTVCMPTPGSDFTYRTETEFTVKTSGIFAQTITGRRVASAKCHVSAESQQSSQLNATLAGDYLTVSCDTLSQDGKKGRADYAYFRDLRFYLSTELTDEWQRTMFEYKEATYREP